MKHNQRNYRPVFGVALLSALVGACESTTEPTPFVPKATEITVPTEAVAGEATVTAVQAQRALWLARAPQHYFLEQRRTCSCILPVDQSVVIEVRNEQVVRVWDRATGQPLPATTEAHALSHVFEVAAQSIAPPYVVQIRYDRRNGYPVLFSATLLKGADGDRAIVSRILAPGELR